MMLTTRSLQASESETSLCSPRTGSHILLYGRRRNGGILIYSHQTSAERSKFAWFLYLNIL